MFKKVYVEITNHCNKNCSFCSTNSLEPCEMSLDNFEHVLKEIKPFTKYIYLHVKGEPLIHKHFKEIIDLCFKYSIYVNITTNGSFLSKYKDTLKNNIVKQINISLQSYNSKIDDIDDIIKSSLFILKGSKANIVFRFWALKNNEFSSENKMIITKIEEYTNTHLYELILKEKNIKVIERLYINKSPLFLWPNLNNPYTKEGFCYGLKTHIAVLSNGVVTPCCLDSDGVINLGNIYSEKLIDILNKERTKKIKSSFIQNKCSEELCKRCEYRLRFKKML